LTAAEGILAGDQELVLF